MQWQGELGAVAIEATTGWRWLVDWTYAGLAAEMGQLLKWEWEPRRVAFDEATHYWKMTHPVVCYDRRLRDILRVTEPDPRAALEEATAWLWHHRDEVADAEAMRRAET